MTIDEAIKYVRRVEEYNRRCNAGKDCMDLTCREKEEMFKQLAEWLEELKERRQMMKKYGHCGHLEADIRNKAIDDFFDELQNYEDSDNWLRLKMSSIYQIAEQLKEGSADNE